MNANELMIIIPILFGLVGFFSTFFMRRSINIALFVVVLYGSFLLLDRLYMPQDWRLFHEIVANLLNLGSKFVALIKNLLTGASSAAIFLFLIGGAVGLVSRKGA